LQAPQIPIASLGALCVGIAIVWGAAVSVTHANPTGGVAIVGQATMVTNGNQLVVTTQNGAGGNHSAINWQSFSISAGSTTHFQQPSAASMVINRVVTNTPSVIFGTLSSNGNLVLVNQAGIAVGAGAIVDTAGFTASSLRMTDADAIAGRMRFGDGTLSATGVSVQGSILARSGDVVLIGASLDAGKDALIQAPNGSTILAAGQQIEITGRGLEGISLQVQAPEDSAVNLGTLKAGAVGIFAGTLKHSGLIQAMTATLEGGKVVLKATGDAYVEGAGKILATGAIGGSVDVLGNRVAVMDQALIDVSGDQGGGTVRVGGDYQGKNASIQNASMAYVGAQTSVKADAIVAGNGGKVIIWADDATRYFGEISAKGGAQKGDGGFVEVSGKGFLDFNGVVDTSAQNGDKGTLLLDPTNVYIAAAQAVATTAGMTGGDTTVDTSSGAPTAFSASGTPTDSLLLTATLNAALISNNVTVSTAGGGSGVGNIVVASNITKSSGSATTLKLIANNNVVVKSGVSISATSAGSPISVVLNADSDADANGGAIWMDTGSSIVTKGGSITLGGGGNPLVTAAIGNATLGDGVFLDTATLDAGAGAISIRGTAVSGTAVGRHGVSVLDSVLRTTSGAISLVGNGGGSSGYNNKSGVYWARGTLETDTGAIDLNGTGGSGGTFSNMGVYFDSGLIRSNVSGTITITGVGGSGSTGVSNYGVYLHSAATALTVSSVAGAIVINGTATGNSEGVRAFGGSAQTINVTSTGSASISLTGAGSGTASQQSFQLDGSGGAITIGGASASGNISFIAGGALEDIAILSGVTIKSSGSLSLRPLSSATAMGIGAGAAQTFNLGTTELAAISNGFSGITIGGNAQSGAITVSDAVLNDNLTLETTGGISIPGGLASSGNTVKLKFGGAGITQSVGGSVTASSLELEGTGLVSMIGTSNLVSTLSATLSGNTNQSSYWNAGALSLGPITSAAGLSLKTSGGTLTQTGAVVLGGGTSSVIDSGGGAITLTNSGNQFRQLGITNAGAVSINNNATALQLDSVSTTSFNLYTLGNLNLAGTVSASAAGDAVVLRSDGTLSNSTATLSTPNGRWLIYLKDPVGHAFPTTPAFKQYNAAYGDTVLGTGNGVLYNNTTPAVLTASLTGTTSKTYDGLLSTDLTGAVVGSISGGYIDGDSGGTLSLTGATGSLNDASVGTGKLVTASGFGATGISGGNGIATVYGYKSSASGSIGTVKDSTVAPALSGVTVAEFLDKFALALESQQDSTAEKDKAKDVLVVEGEICRP
jgi:filamentous hemagglutinin family protein